MSNRTEPSPFPSTPDASSAREYCPSLKPTASKLAPMPTAADRRGRRTGSGTGALRIRPPSPRGPPRRNAGAGAAGAGGSGRGAAGSAGGGAAGRRRAPAGARRAAAPRAGRRRGSPLAPMRVRLTPARWAAARASSRARADRRSITTFLSRGARAHIFSGEDESAAVADQANPPLRQRGPRREPGGEGPGRPPRRGLSDSQDACVLHAARSARWCSCRPRSRSRACCPRSFRPGWPPRPLRRWSSWPARPRPPGRRSPTPTRATPTPTRLRDCTARIRNGSKPSAVRSLASRTACRAGSRSGCSVCSRTLVSALAFAVAVPLASGALTVAVADRLGGGSAGWFESWMLLLGRAGKLLAAIVSAAGLIAIGLVLWVIPGLAVALLLRAGRAGGGGRRAGRRGGAPAQRRAGRRRLAAGGAAAGGARRPHLGGAPARRPRRPRPGHLHDRAAGRFC